MPIGAPDYFKRILLYGLYNGAPVPLLTDEQGRLIAKFIDTSPFDPTGTIILADDFSAGLGRFVPLTQGTGSSVAVDNSECYSAGWSAKLTAGSDGLCMAALYAYLSGAVTGKIGIEFQVRFGDDIEFFKAAMRIYDGVNYHPTDIRYNMAAQQWEVYAGAILGYVAVLENAQYTAEAGHFYQFKWVVDIPNDVHHRFKHAGGELDLSEYVIYPNTAENQPEIQFWFYLTSTAGNNAFVYIDDVIVTQNES